jgi:hypothetical protein
LGSEIETDMELHIWLVYVAPVKLKIASGALEIAYEFDLLPYFFANANTERGYIDRSCHEFDVSICDSAMTAAISTGV